MLRSHSLELTSEIKRRKRISSLSTVEKKGIMSEHKNLSKALDALVRPIVNETTKSIPEEIGDIRSEILQRLRCTHLVSTYGIMGSNEDIRKIRENEYQFQIILELPFGITPVRDEERRGFVKLKADDGVEHPAVVDGYVERGALNDWIYSNFNVTSCRYLNISYFKRTYEVKDRNNFSLKCLPVLEFDYSKWPLPDPALPESSLNAWPWYAVPDGRASLNKQSFLAWAPDWERCILDAHYPHYQKVQILMNKLLSAHGVTFCDVKDWIQTTLVHATLDKGLSSDLTDCLIESMERLMGHLKEEKLIKLFTENVNLLRSVTDANIEFIYETAVDLVSKLKKLKSEAESGDDKTKKSVAQLVVDLKEIFNIYYSTY